MEERKMKMKERGEKKGKKQPRNVHTEGQDVASTHYCNEKVLLRKLSTGVETNARHWNRLADTKEGEALTPTFF